MYKPHTGIMRLKSQAAIVNSPNYYTCMHYCNFYSVLSLLCFKMVLEFERIVNREGLLNAGLQKWRELMMKVLEFGKKCKKAEVRSIALEVLSKKKKNGMVSSTM